MIVDNPHLDIVFMGGISGVFAGFALGPALGGIAAKKGGDSIRLMVTRAVGGALMFGAAGLATGAACIGVHTLANLTVEVLSTGDLPNNITSFLPNFG